MMDQQKKKLKKRKYFYCKIQGHYIKDCAEEKKDGKNRTWDASVASDDSSDDRYHSADLLMATTILEVNESLSQDECFIYVLIEVSFISMNLQVVVEHWWEITMYVKLLFLMGLQELYLMWGMYLG